MLSLPAPPLIISSPLAPVMISLPLAPVILSTTASPLIVKPSVCPVRLTVVVLLESSLISSIPSILVFVEKVWLPEERTIVSVPALPTKVSELPSPAATTLKVSLPPSPVNSSVPAPLVSV